MHSTELTVHTTKKVLKEDQNLQYSVAIVVPMDTPREDVLKDQYRKVQLNQKKYRSLNI